MLHLREPKSRLESTALIYLATGMHGAGLL